MTATKNSSSELLIAYALFTLGGAYVGSRLELQEMPGLLEGILLAGPTLAGIVQGISDQYRAHNACEQECGTIFAYPERVRACLLNGFINGIQWAAPVVGGYTGAYVMRHMLR